MGSQEDVPMLIVKGVDASISNEDLRNQFISFNPTKARVVYRNGQCKGFAAVEFTNQSDVERALQGMREFRMGELRLHTRPASAQDRSWFVKTKYKKKRPVLPDSNAEFLNEMQRLGEENIRKLEEQERIKKQKLEDQQRALMLQAELNRPITALSMLNSLQAAAKYKIFVIDVQTYFDGAKCQPCEVALIHFSIEEGISSYRHKIIPPGEIPKSMLPEALWKSQHVHGIPLSDGNFASSNANIVWGELRSLLCKERDPRKPPLIFAKNPSSVTNSLIAMATAAGQQMDFTIRAVEEALEQLLGLAKVEHWSSTMSDRFSAFVTNPPPKNRCNTHQNTRQFYCSFSNAVALMEAIRSTVLRENDTTSVQGS